jgi:menaquinone-dependent protoporphyrinogen oxidase
MTHVLVCFASKHGATAEIADKIAETLCESGIEVDCVEARDVASLDDYDAVVLGSAVYFGRWRREARRFLHHFADVLATRPLWVFSSGPVGVQSEVDSKWLEPARVIAEVEGLGAREHVVFGGRSASKGVPESLRDLRDWDEIRDWARRIAADLPIAA